MSHMVIFRTPEGKPGYQPAETVQDAVEVVERLRNDEGVENVRIFRLEELSFEYRPYYKVELQSTAESAPSDSPSIFSGAPDAGGSTEVADEQADAAAEVPEPTGEGHGDGDAEVPAPPASEHPPWASPPPPPPPDEHSGDEGHADDEYSGAGQRRGLFGR